MTNVQTLPPEVLDNLVDTERYIEAFLSITSEADEFGFSAIVPFKLHAMQQHYLRRRTKRDVMVKARRMGASSVIDGIIFHAALTTPNFRGLDVTHNDEATQQRRENYLLFLENLPAELRPEVGKDTKHHLVLPDHKASIRYSTSGQDVVGRGDQFHIVRGTEVSRWPREYIDDNTSGISEAARYGSIAYESTPNGRQGFFYELVEGARLGENEFKLHFYQWWWDPRNSLPAGHGRAREDVKAAEFELQEDEIELMAKHGLNRDQIRWRRTKMRESAMQRQDGMMFFQEYPEDVIQCFIASGETAFNREAISWYLTQCTDPPFKEHDGKVKIWRKPRTDGIYVLSADVGTAQTRHGSFSAAAMKNHKDGKYDLSIKARVPVAEFARLLVEYATQYNMALLAVERNAYGIAVLEHIRRLGYPSEKIYKHRNPNMPRKAPLPGWYTTSANRDDMLENLAELLIARDIQTRDADLFNEMLDMIWEGDKRVIPKGRNDDLIFAYAINEQVQPRREREKQRTFLRTGY